MPEAYLSVYKYICVTDEHIETSVDYFYAVNCLLILLNDANDHGLSYVFQYKILSKSANLTALMEL